MKPRNIITKQDFTNINDLIKANDKQNLKEDQPPTYDDYWQILLKFVDIRPIFHKNELVFFNCMGAHMPDSGGARPGAFFFFTRAFIVLFFCMIHSPD